MALSDRSVTVTLAAKVDGFVANVKKASNAVGDFTKTDLSKQAKSLENISTKASLLGGAVALGVGAAVAKFADFDQAMSASAAATQATGAQIDGLRELAIQMGADTQYSATEAAEGITAMGKAGVATADIMGGGLQGALNLAAAGQLEVGQSAEIAATAMTQFGLSGKDLPHVADLFAAAAGKAQGSVQDVAEAMKFVGPVAHGMGVSIEETAGVIAEFASQGIVGSMAGESLRGILLSLTSPSERAAKKMSELGINVYDANGKFVGLAGVAQQLHDRLGPLDEATRNAALGQIFSNAQVTQARILYEGGAEAVQDWTNKVNDAGFAQDQASKLTDNLRGDLERLGGSIDTALIQGGSGANGALRTLTQGLTGVVNAAAGIPGPLLLAGGAFAALALTLPKGASVYRQYRSDLDAMGLSMDKISGKAPRMGAALGGVSKAITLVAVAQAAVQLQDMAAAAAVATPPTETLAQGLRDVANGAGQSRQFGSIFASGLGVFRNDMESTSASLEQFGTNARLALDPSRIESLFGSADRAATQFELQAKQLDTALASLVQDGHADEAKRAFDSLVTAAVQSGANAGQVKEKFAQYNAAVAATAASAGPAKEATKGLGDAQKAAAISADDAARANDKLLQSLSGYANLVLGARDAARDYEASLDAADSALAEYRQGLIDEAEKNGKGEKAAKAYADAVIASGAALDKGTEAGRKNGAALDAIASATLKNVTKTFESRDANTSLADAVKTATDQVNAGREAFIKHAVDMGLGEDAAVALADKLKLTTDNVSQLSQTIDTSNFNADGTINVNTADANAKIAATQGGLDKVGASHPNPVISAQPEVLDAVVESSNRKLAALDGTRPNPSLLANSEPLDATVAGSQRKLDALDASHADPTLFANSAPFDATTQTVAGRLSVLDNSQADPTVLAIDRATGVISVVSAGLAGLHDKSVTVTTYYASVESGIRHATGGPAVGPVQGPGTGTSDSIPAWLSNGEHVWTAAEVAALGGHAEMFRLRKAVLAKRVAYLASGGPAVAQYMQKAPAAVFAPGMVPSSHQVTHDSRIYIDRLIATDFRSFEEEAQSRQRLANLGVRGG